MSNTIAQAASKPLDDGRDAIYNLSLSFLVTSLILFVPDFAYAGGAAGGDPLSTTICLVVGWLTGGVGQAVATLGIVVLGIGAIMGKVSWQMALIVAFGLSVMFSGARIVSLLTSQDASFCVGDVGFSAGYIEAVLCRVAEWANTATGRALGTLGIIFLGVTALMGKISAGLGITVAIGIATMFGADDVGRILVQAAGGSWIACSPVAA